VVVAQLAESGLIDEYQIVLNPLVVGSGRTLFEGVKRKLPFEASEVARLRQRQCRAVLRAGGVT